MDYVELVEFTTPIKLIQVSTVAVQLEETLTAAVKLIVDPTLGIKQNTCTI
jgi:predicted nucleotidyltransferase